MMQTIITCTWHNRHHVMLATASMDLEALQCSRYWLLPTTIWVLSVVAELVVPGGGDHPILSLGCLTLDFCMDTVCPS